MEMGHVKNIYLKTMYKCVKRTKRFFQDVMYFLHIFSASWFIMN